MSLADLTYGQSITDGCIGWEDSLTILENLAQGVRDRRVKIAQQAA
jgi:3-deoxy-7-phosphoheptulonate synthase